jgi:hypothetical protein
MLPKTALVSGVLTGLVFVLPAFAAEGKFNDKFCFVAKNAAVIDAGDGYKAGNFEADGIRLGPEGDPFANMVEHCVGHFTIVAGQQEDTVYCYAEDKAGDKVSGIAIRKFDPTKPIEDSEASFRVVHGTGKFAGVTGEGKSKIVNVITRTPEKMVACSESTGTYHMK